MERYHTMRVGVLAPDCRSLAFRITFSSRKISPPPNVCLMYVCMPVHLPFLDCFALPLLTVCNCHVVLQSVVCLTVDTAGPVRIRLRLCVYAGFFFRDPARRRRRNQPCEGPGRPSCTTTPSESGASPVGCNSDWHRSDLCAVRLELAWATVGIYMIYSGRKTWKLPAICPSENNTPPHNGITA